MAQGCRLSLAYESNFFNVTKIVLKSNKHLVVMNSIFFQFKFYKIKIFLFLEKITMLPNDKNLSYNKNYIKTSSCK